MRSPAIFALFLPLTLGACDRATEAQEPADLAGALVRHDAARVRVLPVVRREMVRTLETTTVVESERRVVIQARTTGELVELLAEEGDQVEAGALLARLDQRDARAQLDDAKIALKEAKDAVAKGEIAKREADGNIEQARLAFEAAKRNYERNETAQLISAQDLEKLQLDMNTADSQLKSMILAKDRAEIEGRAAATSVDRAALAVERAEVTLSYTELRAPFAGVIADRKCQEGDNISVADEAFTLTDLSDLRTVFFRPQRELALFTGVGFVREDDELRAPGFEAIEVSAEAEALPGHTFHGHIERVSPEIDSASGSFRVTVRLEPEADGLRLLPGMLLRLRLVVERHPDTLVVSKRALKREGDTTILFVARDGRAERVVVEELFSDDDEVEVAVVGAGSLAAGDLVVVVGNRDLEDGKEIEIASWDEGATATEAAAEDVESDDADAVEAQPSSGPSSDAGEAPAAESTEPETSSEPSGEQS